MLCSSISTNLLKAHLRIEGGGARYLAPPPWCSELEVADQQKISKAVHYISSCHMLTDKALSSDKSNGHWFEADWLHSKRDALSSNRKVDGSRLTGTTQACHS